ncbi:MAG: AAA family ATPase [Chloroflexi bacterium]|nr:AAA family ATPase [Chloroflexota bacterium]
MDRARLLQDVGDLRSQGRSIRAIAAHLGVHRSKVERALRVLNSRQGGAPGRTRRSPLFWSTAPTPFVGRRDVLGLLRTALRASVDNQGQIVLLAGEPGIGKTRTAQRFAAYAQKRGALVLKGRCYEGQGAPAYWPWIQVVRTYLQAWDARAARSVMGPHAGALAEIVPEMKERLPALSPVPRLAPREAQFRLFDAVGNLLSRASRQQPLVLILDDMHAADPASLLMLEFVGRALEKSRMLLVAAYRDTETSPAHPLAQVLGEMARERQFRRVFLRPLDRQEVASFLKSVSGITPSVELAEAVLERSGGNPLFLTEIARDLFLRDAFVRQEMSTSLVTIGSIPQTVREAIRLRLGRLSPQCNELLAVAAIIGQDFGGNRLDDLETGMSQESVLAALDEARSARLIEEVPGRLGRYRFTHALVHEVVAADIPRATSAQLHARVVKISERKKDPGWKSGAAELARHCEEALPVLGLEKFLRYSAMAGEEALATHAHEQALVHFQRALATCDGRPKDDQVARLHMGMARALSARSDFGGSIRDLEHATQAFDYYLANGNWREAVEAVEIAPPSPHPDLLDARLALSERLIAAVPGDSVEAARALSAHGELLGMTGNLSEARRAFQRALDFAREAGDQTVELSTLARKVTIESFHLQTNLGDCHRVVRLARLLRDPVRELQGAWAAVVRMTEAGDAEKAASLGARSARLAERIGVTFFAEIHWGLLGMAYSNLGEWNRGRTALERGLALGPRVGPSLAIRAVLEFQAGDFQRGAEHLERLQTLVDWTSPIMTLDQALLAATSSVAARNTGEERWVELAERAARSLPPSDLVTVPAQYARVGAAYAACIRQEPVAAQEHYDYFARSHGVSLCAVASPTTITSQRLFALLRQTTGRLDEAIGHFRASVAFSRRAGYRPELAWSCYDCARALGARAGREDISSALSLLAEGLELSKSLGMHYLTERAADLQVQLKKRVRRENGPANMTEREVMILRLIAKGMTDHEIAQKLVISVKTVGHHVTSILIKTNARNRTEAAVFAARHSLT